MFYNNFDDISLKYSKLLQSCVHDTSLTQTAHSHHEV